jgi:CHAD domain-containing protein
MGYRLKRREAVGVGVGRIAREQLDKALGEVGDTSLDRHKTVHQGRKRCKKLRGLARLVRPTLGARYREINATFRDAARELSAIRDAQSSVESFDKLVGEFEGPLEPDAFASVRQWLAEEREKAAAGGTEFDALLARFGKTLRDARSEVSRWELASDEFDAVCDGLGKTYGRGRDAMKSAYEQRTADAFHEWRKRVKYHWYHLRLLQPIWSPVLKRQRQEADRLGDLLGDDHDLAVLRSRIVEEAEESARWDSSTVEALLGLLDRRRLELQSLAWPLGYRLFAEKPSSLIRRFGCYWDAWRQTASRQPPLTESVAS